MFRRLHAGCSVKLKKSDVFQLQGAEQACACAVYLACEEAPGGDASVSEWAARAFFLYGSQPAPAPLFAHSQTANVIGIVFLFIFYLLMRMECFCFTRFLGFLCLLCYLLIQQKYEKSWGISLGLYLNRIHFPDMVIPSAASTLHLVLSSVN